MSVYKKKIFCKIKDNQQYLVIKTFKSTFTIIRLKSHYLFDLTKIQKKNKQKNQLAYLMKTK